MRPATTEINTNTDDWSYLESFLGNFSPLFPELLQRQPLHTAYLFVLGQSRGWAVGAAP